MLVTTADYLHQHLQQEVDLCIESNEVLHVKRQEGDFVIIGAEDWRAIEETLFLKKVPGLVESILRADQEPLEQGVPIEESSR